MILGIDASNIRLGGGITHLTNLLRAARPGAFGFSQVVLWGGSRLLDQVEDRPWLVKVKVPMLDGNLLSRTWWQKRKLEPAARQVGCDLLFAPGGLHGSAFHPVVTMHRSMLPFALGELRRYGCSLTRWRLLLLRRLQVRGFRKADGVIFLTKYGRDVVAPLLKGGCARTAVVNHGVDRRFEAKPRLQSAISSYRPDRPFRILYVSAVEVYKHPWNLAEAAGTLIKRGLPVHIDIAGPGDPAAIERLHLAIEKADPEGRAISYLGNVPHDQLHALYAAADMFAYMSTCETFGQSLTEAMLSGLPIACSRASVMPELLGDTAVYFDAENPADIARVIGELIDSPAVRERLARASFARAHSFSWERCASETFEFLAEVVRSVTSRKAS